MRSLPCHFPDWREIGARPAKLAACFPLKVKASARSFAALNAEVVIEEIGEDQQPTGEGRRVFPMAYSGPALRTLTLDIDLPPKAGFFRLILKDISNADDPRDIGEGIVFSVST